MQRLVCQCFAAADAHGLGAWRGGLETPEIDRHDTGMREAMHIEMHRTL
jgi:hypothetical protein